MIDYFNTPMWKTVMISFIEENCILFDNDDAYKFLWKIRVNFLKNLRKQNDLPLPGKDRNKGISYRFWKLG